MAERYGPIRAADIERGKEFGKFIEGSQFGAPNIGEAGGITSLDPYAEGYKKYVDEFNIVSEQAGRAYKEPEFWGKALVNIPTNVLYYLASLGKGVFDLPAEVRRDVMAGEKVDWDTVIRSLDISETPALKHLPFEPLPQDEEYALGARRIEGIGEILFPVGTVMSGVGKVARMASKAATAPKIPPGSVKVYRGERFPTFQTSKWGHYYSPSKDVARDYALRPGGTGPDIGFPVVRSGWASPAEVMGGVTRHRRKFKDHITDTELKQSPKEVYEGIVSKLDDAQLKRLNIEPSDYLLMDKSFKQPISVADTFKALISDPITRLFPKGPAVTRPTQPPGVVAKYKDAKTSVGGAEIRTATKAQEEAALDLHGTSWVNLTNKQRDAINSRYIYDSTNPGERLAVKDLKLKDVYVRPKRYWSTGSAPERLLKEQIKISYEKLKKINPNENPDMVAVVREINEWAAKNNYPLLGQGKSAEKDALKIINRLNEDLNLKFHQYGKGQPQKASHLEKLWGPNRTVKIGPTKADVRRAAGLAETRTRELSEYMRSDIGKNIIKKIEDMGLKTEMGHPQDAITLASKWGLKKEDLINSPFFTQDGLLNKSMLTTFVRNRNQIKYESKLRDLLAQREELVSKGNFKGDVLNSWNKKLQNLEDQFIKERIYVPLQFGDRSKIFGFDPVKHIEGYVGGIRGSGVPRQQELLGKDFLKSVDELGYKQGGRVGYKKGGQVKLNTAEYIEEYGDGTELIHYKSSLRAITKQLD